MPAYKYYAREHRLYRDLMGHHFRSHLEIRRAIEYLCRHFGLPYIEVYDAKPRPMDHGGVRFEAAFLPENRVTGVPNSFSIPTQGAGIWVVAHEFAHYLDYERSFRDGRRIQYTRGLFKRYWRWHGREHTRAMREVVELLVRRLGVRVKLKP